MGGCSLPMTHPRTAYPDPERLNSLFANAVRHGHPWGEGRRPFSQIRLMNLGGWITSLWGILSLGFSLTFEHFFLLLILEGRKREDRG